MSSSLDEFQNVGDEILDDFLENGPRNVEFFQWIDDVGYYHLEFRWNGDDEMSDGDTSAISDSDTSAMSEEDSSMTSDSDDDAMSDSDDSSPSGSMDC